MKTLAFRSLLVSLVLLYAAGAVAAKKAQPQKQTEAAPQATKAQKQAEVRKTAQDMLARLYKAQPAARNAVEKAGGYAAFSNVGFKTMALGPAKAEGMAVDNLTKGEAFMKAIEAQPGRGMGEKNVRQVWIFETRPALDRFVNKSFELGPQMTAKVADKGAWAPGAFAVAPGIWLYQLTDKGLATELTAKGMKYVWDDELK